MGDYQCVLRFVVFALKKYLQKYLAVEEKCSNFALAFEKCSLRRRGLRKSSVEAAKFC